MDEEVDTEKTRPPKTILIQSTNLEDWDSGKKFMNFPGSQEHYGADQVVIPVDGKPSIQITMIALIVILMSTGLFLFSIDSALSIDDDFLCCLLCNGNAMGMILLGISSSQYGKWKSDMGAKVTSGTSYFASALFFILAIIFVVLWAIYYTSRF